MFSEPTCHSKGITPSYQEETISKLESNKETRDTRIAQTLRELEDKQVRQVITNFINSALTATGASKFALSRLSAQEYNDLQQHISQAADSRNHRGQAIFLAGKARDSALARIIRKQPRGLHLDLTGIDMLILQGLAHRISCAGNVREVINGPTLRQEMAWILRLHENIGIDPADRQPADQQPADRPAERPR